MECSMERYSETIILLYQTPEKDHWQHNTRRTGRQKSKDDE